MGSLISFTATLLFIFILWEAFAAQRPSLQVLTATPALEWRPRLPAPFHTYQETLSVTAAPRRKNKFRPTRLTSFNYYRGRKMQWP